MGNYITVDEVRAEGAPPEYSDARITARIAKWEMLVEKMTRNIFRAVSPGELIFAGNDTSILHFNVPIISVTSLTINDETTALNATEYRAFTGNSLPQDDRHNPKIILTGAGETSIFTRGHRMFIRGTDQKLTAKWGYTETGDVTPPPIKDAIIALVLRDLKGYFDQYASGETAAMVGAVQRERTDDHEIEYQELATIGWSIIPTDIRAILMLFRAPLAIDAIDTSVGSDAYQIGIFSS